MGTDPNNGVMHEVRKGLGTDPNNGVVHQVRKRLGTGPGIRIRIEHGGWHEQEAWAKAEVGTFSSNPPSCKNEKHGEYLAQWPVSPIAVAQWAPPVIVVEIPALPAPPACPLMPQRLLLHQRQHTGGDTLDRDK